MDYKNEKRILTIIELAEYLNCSISTIRKLIHNNEIPYFKILSKFYFYKDLINKWIIENHNDINLGGYEYGNI